MRRRGRGRRASGGGGLRDGGPRRNGLAPVGGFARRPGGGAGAGLGGAVEDGAEGEDDADDGEDGEEGEEDLGGLAHVAAHWRAGQPLPFFLLPALSSSTSSYHSLLSLEEHAGEHARRGTRGDGRVSDGEWV